MKKEDLGKMRNTRVVQVPGKGEVVQFLASTERDFNKINLKELPLNDVEVKSSAWEREIYALYPALTQVPSQISETGVSILHHYANMLQPIWKIS